jgi:hypothetical protein
MAFPPRLPEAVNLPPALVDGWVRLRPDTPITASLTKADVDHLYFALNKSLISQDHLVTALTLAINGDTANASEHIQQSLTEIVEGQNRLRQLLISIMSNAVTGGGY